MALRAVVASFVLHAGLAVGFVAGVGGHPPAAGSVAPAIEVIEVIEIDTAVEAKEAPVARAARPLDHTHPYPVPVDHDARPHDPSQPHDHADAHAAHESSPAVPGEAPKLPVFALGGGGGSIAPGTVRVATGGGAGEGSAGSSSTTYAESAVSAPAKVVARITAAYPAEARADEVEGDVGLEIVVGVDGRVVDARVVKRAGHGFDESALLAIRGYRFSPAERDGVHVRVRMPWTVQFRLR